MAKDTITPEERMLRIIENPGLRKQDPQSEGKLFSKISVFFEKMLRGELGLKPVIRVSAVVCGLAALACMLQFWLEGRQFEARYAKLNDTIAHQLKEPPPPPSHSIGLDEVAADSKRRNIFTNSPSSDQQASKMAPPAPSDYKLVGILWSQNPQAMVEDKGGRTHLLSVGDAIGEYRVKAIHQDSAVITDDKSEWELR
jgi:hypothetical protein